MKNTWHFGKFCKRDFLDLQKVQQLLEMPRVVQIKHFVVLAFLLTFCRKTLFPGYLAVKNGS